MMKYRVSFYRKSEVVENSAPRYAIDIEANTLKEAKLLVEQEPDISIRSIYETPKDHPIRDNSGFVTVTPNNVALWKKTRTKAIFQRFCHLCGENPVARYKQFCPGCTAIKAAAKLVVKPRVCIICGGLLSSQYKYCDSCSTQHKKEQYKSQHAKEVRNNTVKRLIKQIAWAEEQLKTIQFEKCKLASRYQGVRPPSKDSKTICRYCLQHFIDVQTPNLVRFIQEYKAERKEEEDAHNAPA